MRKAIAAAAAVALLVAAPSAFAASSPTVTVSGATGIGATSATLHGTVKANGLATTYQFDYGTASTLGKAAPATPASAGSGTAAVTESAKLSGLAPATTYYYELVATNSDGTATSPLETFKTGGNPAPTVTTEPATGVARYTANLVGMIDPNNGTTTYYFQYGLTTSYGFQTATKTLAAGSTPVTVTEPLPGIQPGTVFHYRLIAVHGSQATTVGADVSFQTLPWPRPHTKLTFAVSPRVARHGPVKFTARGSIGLAYTTPATLGCHGTVTIRYYEGRRQLTSTQAPVRPTCTYSVATRIGHLPRHRVALTVKARFGGDAWAAPSATVGVAVRVG